MRLLNVQQGHAAAEARPPQNHPEASGSHLPSEGPGKGGRCATAICLFSFFDKGECVTCTTCRDGIPGCAGGGACPLLATTAANIAAITAGATAVMSVVSSIVRVRLQYKALEQSETV